MKRSATLLRSASLKARNGWLQSCRRAAAFLGRPASSGSSSVEKMPSWLHASRHSRNSRTFTTSAR